MNSALATRFGRTPVGVASTYGAGPSPAAAGQPIALQGGINVQGSTGVTGATGVSAVLLVGLAGLAVFYVFTRRMQGSRGRGGD